MTYRKIGWLLVAGGMLLILTAIVSNLLFQLIASLPSLLGFRGEKTYLVLLQNNNELRPTGGFMGTFALVTLDRGKPTIAVEDIYEPDGQVKGHVEPPAPIQEAFQLGEWRLRDANWDPDFPTAARQTEWFMEKGGVPKTDGVIATTTIAFEEILRLIGPLELRDYGQIVTSGNLWELGQHNAQEGFFPGSTQKREFFSDLAKETMSTLPRMSLSNKLKLVRLGFLMLEEKQIMVYANDPKTQRAFESLHWAGRLRDAQCPWLRPKCAPMSLMVVEANLGVNKANCCVTREGKLDMKLDDTGMHHTFSVTWTNDSSKDRWGGTYKAWVRIYIDAKEQTGFWIDVPEGESRDYAVSFDLPSPTGDPLVLLLQKQSGITEFPLTIRIERGDRDREKTREIKTIIRTDRLFVL